MNILTLINALPGAAAQGLIWGIMAIGVYLTFRILDVADLTVDGTMCLRYDADERSQCVGFYACCYRSRNACRSRYRYLPHIHGNPCDPRWNPDSAWSLLCQP